MPPNKLIKVMKLETQTLGSSADFRLTLRVAMLLDPLFE
jgi:hypothetical protein